MPGGGPPGRPGGGGIPLPIICGGALMPMPLPCGAICAAPITYARTCLLVYVQAYPLLRLNRRAL